MMRISDEALDSRDGEEKLINRSFLVAVASSGLLATSAFAARMDPAQVNGNQVDVCSGSDCSDSGIFYAATQACIQNNRGNRADHWALAGRQGQAEHWTGSGWAVLPTGAVFTWIDCSS